MRKYSILIVLFFGLVAAAVFSGKYSVDLFGGLIGAVLGAVVTVYVAERQVERNDEDKYIGAKKSLRAEINFNLKLLEGAGDLKHVVFTTHAWGGFREFVCKLDPEVANAISEIYVLFSRYGQSVQIELLRGDQGQNLRMFADRIKDKIEKIQRDGF